MTSSAIAGPLLHVVEDDFLIAFDLSCRLSDLGYRVLGPANSVREAHALLAKAAPDAAILDVNLNGEAVTPVAQRLRHGAFPTCFSRPTPRARTIRPPCRMLPG